MKLEFVKFDVIFTEKASEYRWLKHLDISKDTNVGDQNLDKWVLKTKDGVSFGYIGCIYEADIGQLEIMEAGCLVNVDPDILAKAVRTLSSGSVYGEDQAVAFTPSSEWKTNYVIKRAGFEEFLPEEPWVDYPGKYFIKEHKG